MDRFSPDTTRQAEIGDRAYVLQTVENSLPTREALATLFCGYVTRATV